MVAVEHGRYLGEHIPNAKYVEVPGSDYFIYLGEPDVQNAIEEFITGVPPEVEPDRVLATVMFTDIVGSTDRAVEVGDRQWRHILDVHDYLVRRNVESFRGRVVKTTGDGILATFDGPARAIRAGFAIRETLTHEGLEIRSGLHAGEVEMRGDDVGGIAVHIGARIAAVARPQEVLCSRTVKELTVGSGIVFEDRGEQSLKGVPDPQRLYSAR
jgi:class 3 adenylate cyclase